LISRRIAGRLAAGVTVFDEDPRDGGLTVRQWIDLWLNTHDNGRRTEWPDGRCFIEQPAIAVTMLNIVGEALREAAEQAGK